MRKRVLATLSLVAATCGFAFSAPAGAAPIPKTFYLDPALSCQLSIPTTDSAIPDRPVDPTIPPMRDPRTAPREPDAGSA